MTKLVKNYVAQQQAMRAFYATIAEVFAYDVNLCPSHFYFLPKNLQNVPHPDNRGRSVDILNYRLDSETSKNVGARYIQLKESSFICADPSESLTYQISLCLEGSNQVLLEALAHRFRLGCFHFGSPSEDNSGKLSIEIYPIDNNRKIRKKVARFCDACYSFEKLVEKPSVKALEAAAKASDEIRRSVVSTLEQKIMNLGPED